MDADELERWTRSRHGHLRCGVEAGRLHRARSGLYVPAASLRDPYLNVATAAHIAGEDGLLSHETSAHLLRLPGHWPLSPAHVDVPRPRQPRPSSGVVVHRPRQPFDSRDVAIAPGGWRCTGVARTVIGLAATSVTGDTLLSLLAELYRLRRLNPVLLEQALLRAGDGLGPRRVRKVDEELHGGFQALSEARFAREVKRTRMPQPHWQVPIKTARGERIIDALWHPLAVELKGRFHLTDLDTWEDDMLREDELAILGLQLLSLPSRLALQDPAAAVQRVINRLRHVSLTPEDQVLFLLARASLQRT